MALKPTEQRSYQKDFYPFAPNDIGPRAYFDPGWRVVVKETDAIGASSRYWWSPKFKTREGAERFDLTRHRLKLLGLI